MNVTGPKKLLLCLLATLGISCGSKTPKPVLPEGRLLSYSYSRYGTMAEPDESYLLERKDDNSLRVECRTYRDTVDLTLTGAKADAVCEAISNIVKEEKVYKFKPQYKTKFQVMDGWSWSMAIKFEDTVITSGGSNAGPNSSALSQIHEYLLSLQE